MVVVWGGWQEVGGEEGAGPATLRYFVKTINCPGPGGERQIKVQGPVNGQSWGRGRGAEDGHHLIPSACLGSERPHFVGHSLASTQSFRVPPKCRGPAQGFRRGHNIWTGSQPPSPEGAGLGTTLQLGRSRGHAKESRERSWPGGGSAAHRKPRDHRARARVGSCWKPSPAPARVGARSPRPRSPRVRNTTFLR